MVLYNKLFAGTYLYLIQIENRGSLELTNYFAYSTLLTLTFFHILFLGGLAMILQQPELILNLGINVLVSVSVFLGGWIFFLRNERYKETVNQYKNKKREAIRFAIVVNILMMSLIFFSGITALLTVSVS